MCAFPPSAADVAYQQRFAPLGLLDETSPYADPPPQLREALIAGAAAGKGRVDGARLGGEGAATAWAGAAHAFDYNDSFFEVGTVDDPAWRIADRAAAFGVRAVS